MISLLRQLLDKKARRGRFRTSWASRRILQRVNAGPKSNSVKRVLWLLQALRKAEALRLQLNEAWSRLSLVREAVQYELQKEFPASFSDPQLQAQNLQFQKLLKQIENRLKRYHWTPTVRSVGFGGLYQAHTWHRQSKDNQWENLAVDYLLRHVSSGAGRSPSEILRLRQCRQCQKWFYAVTEHQTNCTQTCRKKFHSESPSAHSKRAEYMREYRRVQKERDRRAREGARASESAKKKGTLQ